MQLGGHVRTTPLALCLALFLGVALACGGELPSPVPEESVEAVVEQAVEPPGEPLGTAYMVIIGGSTDKAETEAMLAEYYANGLHVVGEPQMVDSTTVAGLNPGFWVLVIATVADEEDARTIATAWDAGPREGSYYREVQVAHSEAGLCSGRALPDRRCTVGPAPGWRAIVIFDETDGMRSEDWGYYTGQVCEAARLNSIVCVRGPDPGASDFTTTIAVDGETLGTVDLAPHRAKLFGYVFAEEGKTTAYEPHGMPGSVLSSARAYFGEDLVAVDEL